MATAIEFNHVGKQYRLGLVSTGTISHDLNRWWQTAVLRKEDPYLKIGSVNDRTQKADSDYVWALRDIDFKVEQGDVVGIIGKNGAGKSTLLKLLSKVTGPTVGSIRARGRIASLLEVGTGFHPEMTGRENIYMNGAIMGMTKQEISAKLDEIVAFSGCEKYIDTPVKRYSSGMTVRLGFAVAAFMEPEILVVDEVLAVGDFEFQKKAIGKMQDVSRGEGRTVLFVSHNMASIRQLCNSGVLLENGQVVYRGTANDTISQYLNTTNFFGSGVGGSSVSIYNKAVTIDRLTFNDKLDNNLLFVGNAAKTIKVNIHGQVAINMNISVEIMLYSSDETLIASYSPTQWDGTTYHVKAGRFDIMENVTLPKMLISGEYFMSIRLSQINIEQLVYIDRAVNIVVEQFVSPKTNDIFYQSYSGGIIMHDYE